MKMKCVLSVLGALGFLAHTQSGLAGEPTAFELIKEGNRHIGEDPASRDSSARIKHRYDLQA